MPQENIALVSPDDVLERLTALPISTWSYITEGSSVRHMGPMAQDFHAAFRLGTSDRRIGVIDANGVSMAAIQALNARVEDLCDENEQLRRQHSELLSEVGELRKQLDEQ